MAEMNHLSPEANLHQQLFMHTATDQLEWRVQQPARSGVDVIFWPMQPRATTVIHAMQAWGAAAMSKAGAEVIVGVQGTTIPPALQHNIEGWFAMTPGASLPTFTPLVRSAEEKALYAPRQSGLPVTPWHIYQDYFGRLAARDMPVAEALAALKIAPKQNAYNAFDLQQMLAGNVRRIETPAQVWPSLFGILQERPSSTIMTLGGADEEPLWNQLHTIYGDAVKNVGHLFLAKLQGSPSTTLPRLSWRASSELLGSMRAARCEQDWHQSTGYFRWMIQNALILPQLVRATGDEGLGHTWDEISARIDEKDVLEDIVKRISAMYLREIDA